jgi:hypothetical protein
MPALESLLTVQKSATGAAFLPAAAQASSRSTCKGRERDSRAICGPTVSLPPRRARPGRAGEYGLGGQRPSPALAESAAQGGRSTTGLATTLPHVTATTVSSYYRACRDRGRPMTWAACAVSVFAFSGFAFADACRSRQWR